MAGAIFYLPFEVAPSSREGKSGKVTPARIPHHTQARLSPSQVTGSSQFTAMYHEEQHLSELAQQCLSYLLSRGAKLQTLLGRHNHFTPGKRKAVCLSNRHDAVSSSTSTQESELKSSGQGASGHFSIHTLSLSVKASATALTDQHSTWSGPG